MLTKLSSDCTAALILLFTYLLQLVHNINKKITTSKNVYDRTIYILVLKVKTK